MVSKWIIPLSLLILVAACVQPYQLTQTHYFGGKVPDVNTTEKIVYDGPTPIKDVLNTKTGAPEKSQAIATEIYKSIKETKLPYTFKDGKTEVTIKKIELVEKDAKVGYWITATRDGKEVLTHSPIWIVNQPTDIEVSSIYDDIKNEKTTTVKEDPQAAAQQVLAGYVSRQPLGKAEGDDVLIVYTSGNGDGVILDGVDATFTTMRTAAGQTVFNSGTDLYLYLGATSTSGVYDVLYRPYFEFNSSALPDDCTIDSAIVGLPGDADVATQLGTFSIGITGFAPATNGTAVVGDYDAFTNTRYATDITSAAWSTSGYNNYTLNAAGLESISKTQWFNIMLRFKWDIDNDTTGLTWGSGKYSYAVTKSAGHTGTVDPFLQITYTPAGGGDTTPPASITGFTNSSITCVGCTLNWTEPADADLNHTMLYQDNVLIINETNATESHIFTGLNGWQTYTFSTQTCDITGNCNTTWVNQTVMISPVCKIINYIRQFWGLPVEMVI